MLCLSRKKSESIIIAGCITVLPVEIFPDRVRLGIQAPPDVSIHRAENMAHLERMAAPDRMHSAQRLTVHVEEDTAERAKNAAAGLGMATAKFLHLAVIAALAHAEAANGGPFPQRRRKEAQRLADVLPVEPMRCKPPLPAPADVRTFAPICLKAGA